MKLFLLLGLLLPPSAYASWFYNENGGFGIYQPEGWDGQIDGRSSRLTGPIHDTAQSEIFLGSDWTSRVKKAEDLEKYAEEKEGVRHAERITISDLVGYRTGDAEHGSYYVFRIPENVIVVHYDLRGSRDQIEEGRTMLSSIEIRTHGIEQ